MSGISSLPTPNPIATAAAASNTVPVTSQASQDEISMGTFMQLITTELANQDPLDPTDDSSFYSQLAQMGTLQGMDQLNNSSTVQQAQSLMGQTVTATNPVAGGYPTVTGVVSQMSIKDGVYYLGLKQADGSLVDVQMANIQSVAPSSQAQSVTQLASLIGQTVSGTATTTVNGVPTNVVATGTVTGISNSTGQPMLTVNSSNYGVVSVAPSSLTSVGSTGTAAG